MFLKNILSKHVCQRDSLKGREDTSTRVFKEVYTKLSQTLRDGHLGKNC